MPGYPIHLVCSSGGVKCFSYVGAIQKLQQNNISIASVSTCSMGSIIGALVCSGMEIEKLKETILNFPFSFLNKKKLGSWLRVLKFPYSVYKKPDYTKLLEKLIERDMTLGELKIPFSAAALDIRKRSMLAYSSVEHYDMKLSDVIKIATAIPPLAEPFEEHERLLVDAAIGSESPVWMATNYKGNYPIIILKPSPSADENYKKGLPQFLSALFNASAASHDSFTISQIPRAIEININCGSIKAEDFNISKDQIKRLFVEGEMAVENKLRDFHGNFNHILRIEEITTPKKINDPTDRASAVAKHGMAVYNSEIRNRDQIFISYSHKDKYWLDKLQAYLQTMERFRGIKSWSDTQINAGDGWEQEIDRALQATKIAILLVTQNYLASEFIQSKEMKYLLEAAEKEKVSVRWIAVSDSTYKITPLEKIQSANDPAKPLDQLSEALQNAELTKIFNAILKSIE